MNLPTIAELQANANFEPLYLIIAGAANDDNFLIYHMCAYPEHPNDEDLKQLVTELNEDEEFKLDPEVLEKLEYRLYTIDQYKEILEFVD